MQTAMPTLQLTGGHSSRKKPPTGLISSLTFFCHIPVFQSYNRARKETDLNTAFLKKNLLGCVLSCLLGTMNLSIGATHLIRIGLAGFPTSLLHYLGYDEYSEAITSLVLEPLVTLDPQTLQPQAALARRFDENGSKTRFEFEIHPKATFSDGSPVTAADVLATWNQLKTAGPPAATYAALFDGIEHCQALSSQKVVFTSKQPVAAGLGLFSQLFIMPAKVFIGKSLLKDFNESFVGSGPYRIDQVVWGKSISLKRNKQYWGFREKSNERKYQLEQVEFIVQSDPTALFHMLVKDQIDYLYFLSARSWAKDTAHPLFKKGTIKKLEVNNRLPFAMAGIAWNLRKPLFQDVRVRLALAHLFNRDRLIKEFFFDQYLPATGIAHSKSAFHHPKNDPVSFDPQKAHALLKEAGWIQSEGSHQYMKDGKPLQFEILTGNPPAGKYLAFYQEDLRKAGIRITIRVVDWPTYLRMRGQGSFEALDFSRNRDELLRDLDITWHSNGASDPASGNITGFKNKKVDDLLAQLKSETRVSTREHLIQQLDLLISQNHPMAFSWEPKYQRIAFWDRYEFIDPGYHAFSRWNQLFHDWQWKLSPPSVGSP